MNTYLIQLIYLAWQFKKVNPKCLELIKKMIAPISHRFTS